MPISICFRARHLTAFVKDYAAHRVVKCIHIHGLIVAWHLCEKKTECQTATKEAV